MTFVWENSFFLFALFPLFSLSLCVHWRAHWMPFSSSSKWDVAYARELLLWVNEVRVHRLGRRRKTSMREIFISTQSMFWWELMQRKKNQHKKWADFESKLANVSLWISSVFFCFSARFCLPTITNYRLLERNNNTTQSSAAQHRRLKCAQEKLREEKKHETKLTFIYLVFFVGCFQYTSVFMGRLWDSTA